VTRSLDRIISGNPPSPGLTIIGFRIRTSQIIPLHIIYLKSTIDLIMFSASCNILEIFIFILQRYDLIFTLRNAF
jgi:hypothetical protein